MALVSSLGLLAKTDDLKRKAFGPVLKVSSLHTGVFCILHFEFSIEVGRAPACATEPPKLSCLGQHQGDLPFKCKLLNEKCRKLKHAAEAAQFCIPQFAFYIQIGAVAEK